MLESLLAQGKVIDYLCQDESRVGLKSQSGKVITAKGVKPKVAVQWGRENFWGQSRRAEDLSADSAQFMARLLL